MAQAPPPSLNESPSREQQWREIVDNPPQILPVETTPIPNPGLSNETQVAADASQVIPGAQEESSEISHVRRWGLILLVTALLILLGQGVAGDPSAPGNVGDVLQR